MESYSLLLAKCTGPVGRSSEFRSRSNIFFHSAEEHSEKQICNVEPINLAVYSKSGMIGMSVSPTDTGSGEWSIARPLNVNSIQVQTISLDQFCQENHIVPDFLKIDVEGAEYDVLLGGSATIGKRKPMMLIELHHFDGDLAANLVPDLLSKWNYRVQWLEKWPQTSQIFAQPSS